MNERFYRKIIQIKAEDSPNVILGLAEIAAGVPPTNTIVVPGVLPFDLYQKRRRTWDKIRQSVGLDAEFYEGAEVRMFPPFWLNRAAALARQLMGKNRRAAAIGCDPGEGECETAWYVIDRLGVLDRLSIKTPDTSMIPDITLGLMRKWKVEPEWVCFDRGGGGKQAADHLRRKGFNVRTVAFGEPILTPLKYAKTQVREKVAIREDRYTYLNRRAEMYGTLRQFLDPSTPPGFAIPAEYTILRQELSPIPLLYDEEGRIFLPPKNRKDPNSKIRTLIDIIGHSPNEADALVVALHAMTVKPLKAKAGLG